MQKARQPKVSTTLLVNMALLGTKLGEGPRRRTKDLDGHTLWLVGGGQQECPGRSTSLLGRRPCTDHMASDEPSGTTAREAIGAPRQCWPHCAGQGPRGAVPGSSPPLSSTASHRLAEPTCPEAEKLCTGVSSASLT